MRADSLRYPAADADRQVGKIRRVLAEGLTRVDVRQMHFDEWNVDLAAMASRRATLVYGV